MTRETTSYRDATGTAHPTPAAAIHADIQALVGLPASVIAVEHAERLGPLLCEYSEAVRVAREPVAKVSELVRRIGRGA